MSEVITKKRGRPRKNDPEHKKNYMRTYMKEYYEKNKTIQQNQKKNYYYKARKNMPKDYIEKYGEYATNIYKIHTLIDFIREHRPELIAQIKEY